MTEYKKIKHSIVQDFAHRTLANLEFIEKHKDKSDVYEVTQLINSLLGLLIFPKEEFWEDINDIQLDEIPETKCIDHDQVKWNCHDLKELVRHLRNGIGHFKVEFKNKNGEISEVEIKDFKPRNGPQTWEGTITVTGLREFVMYFASGIIDGSLLNP